MHRIKKYPQIDFRWREIGLSFQVQFVKLDYVAEHVLEQDRDGEQRELQRELQRESNSPTMYSETLHKIKEFIYYL